MAKETSEEPVGLANDFALGEKTIKSDGHLRRRWRWANDFKLHDGAYLLLASGVEMGELSATNPAGGGRSRPSHSTWFPAGNRRGYSLPLPWRIVGKTVEEHHMEVAKAEAFSFWTHAIGAAAAIVFLIFLVQKASGARAVTSVTLYASSLVLLFSSSSFHHVVGSMGPRWHAISRRLDHIAIFLLIAGTYTPISLLVLGGPWGWAIAGVSWGIALFGVILKSITPRSPRRHTVGLYLLMGWVLIVAVVPLVQSMALPGLLWILAGGIAYSGGAVMYGTKQPDPWPDHIGYHGIWHIFVLIGAACHGIAIWYYVV